MRTLRTELKHLSPLESRVLTDMCICSKNLYNVALFEVRRIYRETGKTLSYSKIDKWAREHKPKHYKKLSSVNAQETLGKLGEDYASYFALLKKADLHFKPMPPRYKKERLREDLAHSTLKRNRRIQDILHKMSHNLVEYARENGIGCIVAGYNEGWKHEVNIGSANNQKFVCIPHRRFLDYVRYKAESYGIEFKVQEESYTSRCDSLALESIEKHEEYMGRRKHRGLYKSSTGRALNADVNGALNILRKHLFPNGKRSKGKDESGLVTRIVSMGRVFRPGKTAWGLNPCSPKQSSKGSCIHMPAPLGAGS